MKIARVEALHCDAGWRPWTFVKIQTDEGLTGYGECSDSRSAHAIAGGVKDLAGLLVGQDPRAVVKLYWDMYRAMRASPGGIAQKAMAGIECALWDIKAKALGVPVYELFGGPLRDSVRLYWSHCGTSRARRPDLLGTPPLRSMRDIADLGKEVVRRGFTALKTNIVIPGEPARVHMPGFGGGLGTTDQVVTADLLKAVVTLIGTFREAVGEAADLCLDLNFNFKTEGCLRIAKAVEPFNLLWLEIDNYDPEALLQIKMEIDIDDVPWKDELITQPPEIQAGHLVIPNRPGWGADLDEKVLAKHPWRV